MDRIKEIAYIFGSVFTVSNRLQAIGDKFDRNLTVKQWLLLAAISKSGSEAPAITEIARLTGSSRQNVKKMITILEAGGYVTLQKDSSDARILRVTLSEKCADYLKKRDGREREFLGRLFDGFDDEEIGALAAGLSKLDKNITEMEKQYGNEEQE
jgi:DNA-binding MarR family transcriptional regulator